ncbi:superoxide dismutase family protein [Celeribacter indicus]|uniref:Superoxide dismutase, copper/zinc binding protein n=1 Tax=Celeribacter indicus TaxID=1208324 RepID=A0A0B5E6G7_9RHOB|nr:superoxide dismutase family protein [Celeribacter indicus]AJE49045.1 superoxide dismutase, copper/zinc binding protein [Celeribacter indicus]SDW44534.1 superoxide dismutase, Cu-Zn family [Celeribacter indicus]
MKTLMIAALTGTLLAPAAYAAEATADVQDLEGNALGAVRVYDTPSGVAVATITLTELPEGVHAIHLHEVGDCESEDFSSAGGHIAGDREHGVLAEGGPHPGDMPNLTVKENGVGEVEVFLPDIDVERDLLDEDGAAFVMHEGVDDYESQPAGDAGDRLACGAFSAPE